MGVCVRVVVADDVTIAGKIKVDAMRVQIYIVAVDNVTTGCVEGETIIVQGTVIVFNITILNTI